MSRVGNRQGAIQLAGRLILGAVAGKVLGFAREIEMARLLGASMVVDAFRAGITATLLPISPLLNDIVPSVLIPMHRQWTAEGLAQRRFTLLTLVFGIAAVPITLAAEALAVQWVGFLVGGFTPQAQTLTVHFVRVMSLSMPVAVLLSCFSCIEISIGRSRVATIRASVQNIAVMTGIGLMALTGDVMVIAWAFTAAMTASALYCGGMLIYEQELTLRGLNLREAGFVMATFIRRVRTLLVTPFADQANVIFERMLVSGAGVGAIASMEYARTLTDTAMSLVSSPIGFVVLSQNAGDRETARARLEALLRPLLALSLPSALFMVVFATDIVTVVLRRGAFEDHAVALTSSALSGLATGLWASVIGWVFIRMLNAAHRNRSAALILLAGAAGQALVNLVAVPRLGVVGAGLGDSARGVVILVGAACALHSGGLLLRLLLVMSVPALGFVALGEGIRQVVVSPIGRLGLGGGGFAAGIALCMVLLAPNFTRMVRQRVRPRRLRAEA